MQSQSSPTGGRADAPLAPERSVLRALRDGAVAGIFGGVFLFLVEAVDRVATLRASFNSAAEPAVFALYLTPIVFLCFAAGVVVGPAFAALAELVRATSRLVRPLVGRFATIVAVLSLCGAVTVAAAAAIDAGRRALGMRSLGRIASALSLYFMDADKPFLSHAAHALSDKVFPILLVMVFAGALATVAVALLLATRSTSTLPAVLRWGPAVVAATATILVYVLDSRFEYARYDKILHVPAAGAACVLAFFAAALALGALGDAARPTATRVALVMLALAGAAAAFDLVHVGRNENLKALLWRRSVVARRAYEIATFAVDRDRDGFSPLFRGPDADDGNPAVNPLEIGATTAPARQAAPAAANGKRFVLIAIDTLRADRMSLYGYGRPTTPRIDEAARDGLVFDRCYSAGTNTAVAFSSMQTSASRGGVFERDRERMWPRLAALGYRTAQVNAVEQDLWLKAKSTSAPYRDVILDGIDEFPHELGDDFWDADKVTDAAIAYLSSTAATTRTATWVHYFDPHTPRRKMAPFDFGDSASDKYDTEVAFSDREVGRLLDWMRASGCMKDTVVILMADHGEAFMEHGMDFHGNRPYDEQLHVPLVVWAPGLEPGRSAAPTTVLDIAPTVYDFLGMGPMPGAEGVSLLQPLPADRPIFSETPLNIVDGPFRAFAVTEGGHRLIYDVVGNTTELYDLEADPHELHNLADREPDRVRALRAMLDRWMATTRPVSSAREAWRMLGMGNGER